MHSQIFTADETIGLFFGFDAAQAEFLRQPALKGAIETFGPASGLRRICRDRLDLQFFESAGQLGAVVFGDLITGAFGQKEMAGAVGVEGTKYSLLCDDVFN